MKKPEHEIVYDGRLEAVDHFAKEFDGIDSDADRGIQESWTIGLHDEKMEEVQAKDVNNDFDS